MYIPLQFTCRDQSTLADLCSVLRSWLYQEAIGEPLTADELRDRISLVLERFEVTLQKLDELCDKLHQSGANS